MKMIDINEIKKYELYLAYLMPKLEKFFQEQSPYICCKEGCSHCCEKGEYPFSELEFAYIMYGSKSLTPQIINELNNNISQIKQAQKNNTTNNKFLYKCPFLINKRCVVYNFRGLICRTHGLAFFDKNNKLVVPACVDKGLNYSNVYNFEKQNLSSKKCKELGIKQEPLAHNVGLHFILDNSITNQLKINFGDSKSLIDWFED
mgnify:FL=1